MVKVPGVQGLNVGRNSCNAIFKQIVTKFENGTIHSVRPSVAWKMLKGRFYDTAAIPGAGAAVASSAAYPVAKSIVVDTVAETLSSASGRNSGRGHAEFVSAPTASVRTFTLAPRILGIAEFQQRQFEREARTSLPLVNLFTMNNWKV